MVRKELMGLFLSVIFLGLGMALGGFLVARRLTGGDGLTETSFDNRAVVQVIEVIRGRVLKVEGDRLELSNAGGRLTVKAAQTVFISAPTIEASISAKNKDDTIVGNHTPSGVVTKADFSRIEVGREVLLQAVRQTDGSFLVTTVGYVD